MIVQCVVAATSADGTPDFYFCKVECTQEEYDDGDHYEIAEDEAILNGYETPMVVFDENDGPSWLFEYFVWDSASIVTG